MKKLSTDTKRNIISFLSSLVLHSILLILILILNLNSDRASQINRQMFILESNQLQENSDSKIQEDFIERQSIDKSISNEKDNLSDNEMININPNDILTDTTELEQIYSERTLNLSIRYPKGWTYLDQNNKNKLDGVTFWSVEGNYNPPPYIHLEVVEKYLFSPSRFKYKTNHYDSEWYFNDPTNLEGQYSQEVYVRTSGDVDFLIKLIMVGESQFYSFRPKFFALLKSLRVDDFIF